MKATEVKLRTLITPSDHLEAIDSIENDHRNSHGDLKHWQSGKETFLTEAAKTKIAQIYKRFDRLFPDEEGES